jgi:hypothetical protein
VELRAGSARSKGQARPAAGPCKDPPSIGSAPEEPEPQDQPDLVQRQEELERRASR